MKLEKVREFMNGLTQEFPEYLVGEEEAICQLDELERLAEIGRATEKALDIDGMNAYIYDDCDFDITNVEDLLKWYKESEE